MLINANCRDYFKTLKDCSVDLIFTDPPYALGSEVYIRPDGKPDYAKSSDFMDKWKQPDGRFWEEWFVEASRVLKHGAKIVMFGMDRQLMLYKYYACAAGFREHQSLYWYSISSFPKATDLSKAIDKSMGLDRPVIGKKEGRAATPIQDIRGGKLTDGVSGGIDCSDITEPVSDLAKKYSGYKYSVAPLKQTNETIMVFQKPYKSGSCLHDTLAMEAGDQECSCGALNIEDSRTPFEEGGSLASNPSLRSHIKGGNGGNIFPTEAETRIVVPNKSGRYPAQTFVNSEASEALDGQCSKECRGGSIKKGTPQGFGDDSTLYGNGFHFKEFDAYNDLGGCSKILHTCDYDSEEIDLYLYCPKVSTAERGSCKHPTMKPISLLARLLRLFKTPDMKVVVDPFVGSGSTILAGITFGIDVIGIEQDIDSFNEAVERVSTTAVQFDIFNM